MLSPPAMPSPIPSSLFFQNSWNPFLCETLPPYSTRGIDFSLLWGPLYSRKTNILLYSLDCSHEIKRHLLLGRKVMTNLDSIFKSRGITLPTKVRLVKAMVFLWSCMDVRVGLWRKLSAEELMLLNCGNGEDSWESLGLQGDPTSPFWRRSVLGVLWKAWC